LKDSLLISLINFIVLGMIAFPCNATAKELFEKYQALLIENNNSGRIS